MILTSQERLIIVILHRELIDMATLEGEISRLSNKDPSIRRKAVRNLFELDNPLALKGFIDLLNDQDQWFRSKAIEAHRKWAKTSEDILPLLANERRIASELLQNIRDLDIARELMEDEDHIVRSFASKVLVDDVSSHKLISEDRHHSVRSNVASNSSDEMIIRSLIIDKHPIVQSKALENALRRNLDIEQSIITNLLESNDQNVRSIASIFALKIGGDTMKSALSTKDPKTKRAISKKLREMIVNVDNRILSISNDHPDIIVQWLKGKFDTKSVKLRWDMIQNSAHNSILRAKLIEQFEGKTNIDISMVKKLHTNEDDLVRIASINLSASYYELTGEEE